MTDKRMLPFYLVLGIVMTWYCSHAFGLKTVAQDYHSVKPDLRAWHHQMTSSLWYGYSISDDGDGAMLERPPASWDFIVELTIFLSGGLLFLRVSASASTNRNVVVIFRSLGLAIVMILGGIMIDSVADDESVLHLSSLLVALGILQFLGRMLLFLPVRKMAVLIPLALVLLGIHWAIVEYGFGNQQQPESGTSEAIVEHVAPDESLSVWEYGSDIIHRVEASLNRVLPSSVRSRGSQVDYQDYSEVNLVAYAGVFLLGMSSACLYLADRKRWVTVLQLLCMGAAFVGCSIVLLLSGLPAVPKLASGTHVTLAAGFGFMGVAIGVALLGIRYSEKIFIPILAVGKCSAILYIAERALGAILRAELDKHLRPLVSPWFGESWPFWEPFIFFNLIFALFVAGCIYLDRKKIRASL